MSITGELACDDTGYVANYAGNVAFDTSKIRTEGNHVSEHSHENQEGVGWLMGLEPTTTGITIRDSTN